MNFWPICDCKSDFIFNLTDWAKLLLREHIFSQMFLINILNSTVKYTKRIWSYNGLQHLRGPLPPCTPPVSHTESILTPKCRWYFSHSNLLNSYQKKAFHLYIVKSTIFSPAVQESLSILTRKILPSLKGF